MKREDLRKIEITKNVRVGDSMQEKIINGYFHLWIIESFDDSETACALVEEEDSGKMIKCFYDQIRFLPQEKGNVNFEPDNF